MPRVVTQRSRRTQRTRGHLEARTSTNTAGRIWPGSDASVATRRSSGTGPVRGALTERPRHPATVRGAHPRRTQRPACANVLPPCARLSGPPCRRRSARSCNAPSTTSRLRVRPRGVGRGERRAAASAPARSCVRVPGLAARGGPPRRVPPSDGGLVEPERQVSALPQPGLVGRPVSDPVRAFGMRWRRAALCLKGIPGA